jgi:beta-1,4-mannosyl-glycoprotein beta-1,4-N-acetylglucosaminyltransferase
MRIFDSFRFFNELDVLEVRFNLLYDLVDFFVITECPYTIMGDEKPLYYWDNRDRFDKFNDKVIHDIMDDIPDNFDNYVERRGYHTPYNSIDRNCNQKYIDIPLRYQRDMYARDYTAYSIEKAGAKSDDVIITSDADEVINPLVLQSLDWFDKNNHYVALQRHFYYKFNILREENWMGSRICTWDTLRQTSVDQLRQNHHNSHRIESGGWHWSYFGNIDTIEQKLNACADSQHKSKDLSDKVKMGRDPVGRSDSYNPVPIDDSFPEYIQNNQEKYAEFIKPWN